MPWSLAPENHKLTERTNEINPPAINKSFGLDKARELDLKFANTGYLLGNNEISTN
jgi:hypothetical protein